MLIVIGAAQAGPGCRDRLRAAAATVAAATAADDGCDSYGFYTDVTRPEVLLSVEVWRDLAALEAHLLHAHTLDFLAAVPGLVEGAPTMRIFDAVAASAPALEPTEARR